MGAAVALAPVAAQTSFSLEDVRVLSGCWAGTEGVAELRESWTEPTDGVMLGTSRHLRGGAVVDWEFARIVHDSAGVTLWPYPRGVPSAHGFPLVRAGAELVFENLAHDFPVRVVYAVVGPGRMRPRIEGTDGRGPSWYLERVACPEGPPP
jgi:hypothetical protein